MGENFLIEIKSVHKADLAESENVHALSEKDWKDTEVVNIDIADGDMKEWDPKLVDMKKFGRVNVEKGWIQKLKNDSHMEVWVYSTIFILYLSSSS